MKLKVDKDGSLTYDEMHFELHHCFDRLQPDAAGAAGDDGHPAFLGHQL